MYITYDIWNLFCFGCTCLRFLKNLIETFSKFKFIKMSFLANLNIFMGASILISYIHTSLHSRPVVNKFCSPSNLFMNWQYKVLYNLVCITLYIQLRLQGAVYSFKSINSISFRYSKSSNHMLKRQKVDGANRIWEHNKPMSAVGGDHTFRDNNNNINICSRLTLKLHFYTLTHMVLILMVLKTIFVRWMSTR